MTHWTAENIQSLRRRLGWSAADLSRRFSCDLKVILDWEGGVSSPLPEQIRQLETLKFHLNDYSNKIQITPQAEKILEEEGLEQVSLKN
jgi:ribosome-binding protein aMBF1 (putative translation factor)